MNIIILIQNTKKLEI